MPREFDFRRWAALCFRPGVWGAGAVGGRPQPRAGRTRAATAVVIYGVRSDGWRPEPEMDRENGQLAPLAAGESAGASSTGINAPFKEYGERASGLRSRRVICVATAPSSKKLREP